MKNYFIDSSVVFCSNRAGKTAICEYLANGDHCTKPYEPTTVESSYHFSEMEVCVVQFTLSLFVSLENHVDAC